MTGSPARSQKSDVSPLAKREKSQVIFLISPSKAFPLTANELGCILVLNLKAIIRSLQAVDQNY